MITKTDLKSRTVKASLGAIVAFLAVASAPIASLLAVWGFIPADIAKNIQASIPFLSLIGAGFSGAAIHYRKNIKAQL